MGGLGIFVGYGVTWITDLIALLSPTRLSNDLNYLAADATAEWADQYRPPSSPVVAGMEAKDIWGGVWRRCAETQPMWDDVALTIYQ